MNKNIKFKSKLTIVTCIALLLLSTSTFARQIGSFSEFRVTPKGENTGYLVKKGANGSNYVLNLYPSREYRPIRIKHSLVNVNNRRRSDFHLLTCGDRWTFSNWASKGYSYALKMQRENWWDKAISITGSWSPDQ